jgi:hypothetical protein
MILIFTAERFIHCSFITELILKCISKCSPCYVIITVVIPRELCLPHCRIKHCDQNYVL